jgi:hypothetical protein
MAASNKMTACENNLFIQCHTVEQKDYFIHILSNGTHLFQSFIYLQGTKLECYGTASDVYIEYTTIDIDTDPCMLSLLFHTHDLPPLEFCKKLAIEYTVNIQLVYFNQENNYSGEFRMKDNRVSGNTIDSYYQGLYVFERDRFWENIPDSFEESETLNYEEYLSKMNIRLENMDNQKVKDLYYQFLLEKQFENL